MAEFKDGIHILIQRQVMTYIFRNGFWFFVPFLTGTSAFCQQLRQSHHCQCGFMLNKTLDPLLQKYDGAVYNCDWGTISLPEHSLKARLFKLKYKFKANKWAKALRRDTLLLFLMSEVGFLLIRSASSHIEPPLIDLSSVSFVAGTIGAVLLASVRIWVEVIMHFNSRR